MSRKPAVRLTVRLTANFERNLADIARFLTAAEAPQAYDALLDELMDTVIPNLERFPGIGRPFLANAARSVETTNAHEALRAKLSALTPDPKSARGWCLRAVVFIHRFGSALNTHLHFHCCITDGVFETAGAAGAVAGVVFHKACGLAAAAVLQVQPRVRQRVLRAFRRRGLLAPCDRDEMGNWAVGLRNCSARWRLDVSVWPAMTV